MYNADGPRVYRFGHIHVPHGVEALAESLLIDADPQRPNGAAVLEEAKKFPKTDRWLRRMLGRRLTRPGDRELFDLEPLPEADEE